MKSVFTCLLTATAVLALAGSGCTKDKSASSSATKTVAEKKIKIGFIVKQPEEPWFQLEWKFADQAAKEHGFELIKIGAADGEKVLAAIDNLAAAGARGFVICTPDVKLGPAIMMRAKAHNLKVISVDDQFVGADGNVMSDVHHLGISARKIGNQVGQQLFEEMKRRGWDVKDTAVSAVTFNELETARERTQGAREALIASGFPASQIYEAAIKTSDVPGAFDATNILLTQHPKVKNWLVYSMNDSTVLGAIRAMEGRGKNAENAIGIGINGTDCIAEFQKKNETAFYGSMLLSAKEHGYKTTEMLYRWIKDGLEPPKDTRTLGVMITKNNYEQVLREQGVF